MSAKFLIQASLTPELHYSDDLGPNQACTLFGAKTGSNIIDGNDYLSAGYGLNAADLWRRNLLVLIAFFLAFQITQILALEYYPVSLLRLALVLYFSDRPLSNMA